MLQLRISINVVEKIQTKKEKRRKRRWWVHTFSWASATGASKNALPGKYDTPTSYRYQSIGAGNWRQKTGQCVIILRLIKQTLRISDQSVIYLSLWFCCLQKYCQSAIAVFTFLFAVTWQFNQFALLLQAMALYAVQVLHLVQHRKVFPCQLVTQSGSYDVFMFELKNIYISPLTLC